MGLFFQNRVSVKFGVDIHPAARMGQGIMLDHATGLVIGETAVVGNNVSILQSVTLGGTGKIEGDRHPKIGDGVLISAGAKILGNIRVGKGAKVGAGSVVLEDVPAHTTVAGERKSLADRRRMPPHWIWTTDSAAAVRASQAPAEPGAETKFSPGASGGAVIKRRQLLNRINKSRYVIRVNPGGDAMAEVENVPAAMSKAAEYAGNLFTDARG